MDRTPQEQEILLVDSQLNYTVPEIQFNGFTRLRDDAVELAQWLDTIEVDEENIAQAKKMLAKVNKNVKNLNDRRIAIKKEINAPYEEFAKQIKEIENIISEADATVRSQVRELEERERYYKQEKLRNKWERRVGAYNYAFHVRFEDWLEPRHLNKTQTLKKSEEEMVEFLEKVESEIAVLHSMDNPERLIHRYTSTFDLAETLAWAKEYERELDDLRESLSQVQDDEEPKPEPTWRIEVKGVLPIRFLKKLLEENMINYKEIK